MRRVLLFNNLGAQLGELHPNDVLSMERREEINGEHSLTITTIQVLTQGMRVVYQDDRGYWREYVVTGVDENHASGKTLIGSYYCVWSLQVDLQGVTVSKMPGVQNPVSASTALDALLEGQQRWTRGTVSQMSTGGASMYDMSAWQALGVLVENWGGEIGVSISVSSTGVAGRSVSLYSQLGEQQAKRRYDFGADVAGITRKVEDSAIYCRISPRGAGEQTESGGYGRKIRITDVNDGKDYLEYAPLVDAAKLPSGSGYIYPTLIVENSNCKTPAELLTWAQDVLEDTLAPKITYEVDVIQAEREGMDVHGVSLGDVVQVVDRYFTTDGLRVTGRVTAITVDEINTRNVGVTIGYIDESLAVKFADMQKLVDEASERINSLTGYLATSDYLNSLIDRLNDEINATGGYTYIVPGNGILTFDVAVADPLNPVEASKIVEIKGGSIRIANTKDAQGQWEWKSVFVSGHIAAEMITTAHLIAGYIESANGESRWNLDSSELFLSGLLQMILAGYRSNSHVYAELGAFTVTDASGGYNGITSAQELRGFHAYGRGNTISGTNFDADVYLVPCYATGRKAGLLSTGDLVLVSNIGSSANDSFFELKSNLARIRGGASSSYYVFQVDNSGAHFAYSTASGYMSDIVKITGALSTTGSKLSVKGSVEVTGGVYVNGVKPRKVQTEHYADRLLYAYETPSPYFGDIGSATTDENGVCVIAVDDIFSEAVRTDYGYQVFLQPCGNSQMYVAEKTSSYFIVHGAPNIPFDWEIKARQRDFENVRCEQLSVDESVDGELGDSADYSAIYHDEINYSSLMEGMLNEAA